ncbi:olfactory receptor 6C74-like [Ambystoma mexicanum]|uniref:olfactory receptor 6C74-like n=1 Tax=Ambystoma mexicanum TaxID=8296 RepID=UPI0037E97012
MVYGLGNTCTNYADDTQILMPLMGDYDKDLALVNRVDLIIQAWMATHGLCLNDDKTELVILDTTPNLSKLDLTYSSFTIDGNTMNACKTVKTLDFHLGDTLSFTKQIRSCRPLNSEARKRGEMENGTTPKDIDRNNSSTGGFILLGFPDQDSYLLFSIFMLTYLITFTGNVTIIVLTRVDAHLQTPMYYFLGQLSFLEMCYTSVTAPNMIVDLLSGQKSISFGGCMVQLYIFLSLGSTEILLLAVMALDRFFAICRPLRYHAFMSKQVCGWLTFGSWLVGFLSTLGPATLITQLPYCHSHIIDHFFCDVVPLLQLACGDTFVNEMVVHVCASAVVLSSLLVILVSYVNIVFTAVKIPSAIGRWRTFSTCASHLIVVLIFFGTVIFMYIGPREFYSFSLHKALALCYTMLTPLLNPIIYSFRNKEVKQALQRVLRKRVTLRTLTC